MTKEELERIKQAYYSGLKVQIWFNGHWENFDARDYSMHSDPFSENRLYRIVGSAYADIAEKRIAELEKENAELREKVERYYCLLEKSMDCETCKYCDLSDDRKKEPCKSCFFDSSKWELKE
jgi:hypothetical protein